VRLRRPIDLPEDVREKLHKATRLQRWSLAFMISCVVVIYFSLGQSQAMKAVFIEDILAVIPPAAYLLSQHVRWREPTQRHPYGFQRAVALAFLASAASLLALGVFILIESVTTLLKREHPTIGVISVFGHQLWLGWVMIPALLYTISGEYTFGRVKQPYARDLHDTALAADARMNRADWMSGGSAILGVLGIAIGWWWADALAATFIGVEIVRDGWKNVIEVLRDLMDERPMPVEEGERGDWAERLRDRVSRLDWVTDVDVRLRETGNIITGEVYVVPKTTDAIATRCDEVEKLARDLDWRYHDLSLIAVEKL
jgi:cation diffusion facilitator family transporter